MPSPFPGMDPWLESGDLFRDLHDSLIFLIREALNGVLPDGYAAVGKHLVWMDNTAYREPDVSLFGTDRPIGDGGGLATLPGLLTLGEAQTPEPWEEPYLEIRSDRGKRLVTAIEILSPSNKIKGSTGRKAYLEKQEELQLGGVNIVEFDLLRAGMHTTLAPQGRLRRTGGPFDYHASVTVAGNPSRLFGAPIKMPDRLPAIGIPLDPDASPITVDIQPLLDRAYDTGRYPLLVNYSQPPDPPLTAEQQTWAEGILKSKGLLK